MVLSSVDFPQALAPTITVILPLGMVTSTPSTTTRLPYPERRALVLSWGVGFMRRRPVC